MTGQRNLNRREQGPLIRESAVLRLLEKLSKEELARSSPYPRIYHMSEEGNQFERERTWVVNKEPFVKKREAAA